VALTWKEYQVFKSKNTLPERYDDTIAALQKKVNRGAHRWDQISRKTAQSWFLEGYEHWDISVFERRMEIGKQKLDEIANEIVQHTERTGVEMRTASVDESLVQMSKMG
jgi:hypothetical protein